jgi:membrane-associated phospholipid phosphatase
VKEGVYVIDFRLGCLVFVAAVSAVPAVAQTDTPFAPPLPDLKDERLLPTDGLDGLGGGFEGDGVRTLGAFPRNLTRGIGSVFTRDSLRPFLIGAVAAGAGSLADNRVQNGLAGHAQGFGNFGAKAGVKVMAPLTAGLFVVGRVSHDSRFRAATYDLAEAAIVSSLYTTTLKSAVHRNRPDTSDRLSFPSGHTSSAFAMAAVFDAHYGPKVGLPAYAAAAAIGISRMESNKHHLSDVLAGATIGYLVGHSVANQNGVPSRGRERKFELTTATDANGGGAGAGFSLSW